MDGEKRSPTSSSVLIRPVAIAVWLGGCIASALSGWSLLSMFLGFVFALALCALLWSRWALHRVSYSIHPPKTGVFPGEPVPVRRTVSNGKWLPLIWLELLEPCSPDSCALPDARYMVENPEHRGEEDASETHCCLYTLSLLKWHQTTRFTDTWTANRRGIHRIDHALLRSGDGFGLSAVSRRVAFSPPRQLVVYPRLVEVSVDRVLQDMWDSRSSAQGYLEDHTLIRSVRDYQPTDPARHINQRLLARGQGIKVNQYQVVTPDSVLFVLDSASFRGCEDAMERALSVAASLITGLSDRRIQVGLVAPGGSLYAQTFVAPSGEDMELAHMLELLAAASAKDAPLKPVQIAAPEQIGQTYYVTHSLKNATSLPVLSCFPAHKVQIMAADPSGTAAQDSALRVRSIQSYRRVS